MTRIKFPVYFTSIYLLVYVLISNIDSLYATTLLLFSLSPFLIIWMVIRVLKDGVVSTKTWEEGYFYDDREKMR